MPVAEEWHEINDPGFFHGKKQTKPKQEPITDTGVNESSSAEDKKDGPKVRLISAQWKPGPKGFQLTEQCFLEVTAEYLAQTASSRIQGKLYGIYEGEEVDLSEDVQGDLDEKTGIAPLEIKRLWYVNDAHYAAWIKNPTISSEYLVKGIKHLEGANEIDGPKLTLPVLEKLSVSFVEIADVHFHHNCALPCLDAEADLISELGSAFTYARDHADSEMIIEGHADRSGDEGYNLRISKRRAEAIKALLDNKESLWMGVVDADKKDHTIETEDYQETLKSLSAKFGWSCDPGTVDNAYGPKTKAAVENFQKEYNGKFPANEQLTKDGKLGPRTWRAVFFVLRDLLETYCKKDLSLDPLPALPYGYPEGDGIYPCGESSPISGMEKSQEDRRVEVVFYEKGKYTPVIAPTAGKKKDKGTDPVSGKPWDKKEIPAAAPPAPAPVLKVSIKAEDGTSNPLTILKNGNSIKCKAIPDPVGGTYKWTVSGSISIVGSSTNQIVEIKGNSTSSSKEDCTVSVKYEKDGKKVNADYKLTVCTVTITPASMHATESQSSGIFTADVQPAGLNITAYKWLTGSAENAWPASAGNGPVLNYSAATSATTKVNNTRWFAKTPSNLISVDNETCTYKINCEVTLDGKTYRANTAADLRVEVGNFFGSTCNWPEFQNWASIVVAKDASNVWRVTGQGSFSRKAPVVVVTTLASSQFHNKVFEHENLHFIQWTSQDPWQKLFNANDLYTNTISKLTSNVSEADLRSQIFQALQAQQNTDATAARNTKCQRERATWVHENAVAPDFLELTEAEWKNAYTCP
jgi:hypothetical protein